MEQIYIVIVAIGMAEDILENTIIKTNYKISGPLYLLTLFHETVQFCKCYSIYCILLYGEGQSQASNPDDWT